MTSKLSINWYFPLARSLSNADRTFSFNPTRAGVSLGHAFAGQGVCSGAPGESAAKRRSESRTNSNPIKVKPARGSPFMTSLFLCKRLSGGTSFRKFLSSYSDSFHSPVHNRKVSPALLSRTAGFFENPGVGRKIRSWFRALQQAELPRKWSLTTKGETPPHRLAPAFSRAYSPRDTKPLACNISGFRSPACSSAWRSPHSCAFTLPGLTPQSRFSAALKRRPNVTQRCACYMVR